MSFSDSAHSSHVAAARRVQHARLTALAKRPRMVSVAQCRAMDEQCSDGSRVILEEGQSDKS